MTRIGALFLVVLSLAIAGCGDSEQNSGVAANRLLVVWLPVKSAPKWTPSLKAQRAARKKSNKSRRLSLPSKLKPA